MRKGPDGKTIRGPDEPNDDATRKVPRRSIRDRLLAQDEVTDENRATQLATTPTTDAGVGGDAERSTVPGPGGDSRPTIYAGASPAPPREPAPPRVDAPPRERDYVPADTPQAVTTDGSPLPHTRDAGARSGGRDNLAADNPATKIYRPNRPAATPPPIPPAGAAPAPAGQAGRPKPGGPVSADFTIADPVVGWLVVVEGPGRGASLNVGYGNNRIGRAPTENVALDFGDEEISRENHATITFDGRHRRFYVLPGQGRNLVYVNDQPVMTPVELTGGEDILLGQTKLRFVPFCSKTFDWYQK
jgi:hypothetical protein